MNQKPILPLFLLCGLIAAAGALGGHARAAAPRVSGNIAYLGKPTNDAPTAYFPLGGFHRVSEQLTLFGKPTLELTGTVLDPYTGAVGWPIVKALDQFGSFSGLKAAPVNCTRTLAPDAGLPRFPPCSISTIEFAPEGAPAFDFTHAAYRSRYVTFQSRMVIDAAGKLHVSSLSVAERRIDEKYGPRTLSTKGIVAALYPTPKPNVEGTRRLPLVAIGHYLETQDQYVSPQIDFGLTSMNPAPPTPEVVVPPDFVPYLTFAQAHDALVNHRQPNGTATWAYIGNMLGDVNTDANVMTALICKADGSKPTSVCGRSVVRGILKHVR